MSPRLAIALVVACSGSPPPPIAKLSPPPGPPPDAAVAAPDAAPVTADVFPDALPCAERVAAFRAKLDARPARVRSTVMLPVAARWREPVAAGIEVTVDATGAITIMGQGIESTRELRPRLREAATIDPEGPAAVDIHADGAAPAATVGDVLRAVPRGFAARLIVRRATIVDPFDAPWVPPGAGAWLATWIADARALRDKPGELREHITAGMKRAIGTRCPEIPAMLGKVGDVNPAEIERYITEGMSAALEACGCAGVDPAYEAINLLLSATPAWTGWLPLTAKLPRAETVAELAVALADAEP
jgi:hypothetical protein